jgi:hypothetical protein
MTRINPQANPPPSRGRSPILRGSLKQLTWIFAFLGLASLNVLTLVNDKAHAAGYSAIKAILATAIPDAAASRMLSNSSTVKRKQDAMVATQKLAAERDMVVASSKVLEAKQLTLLKSLKEVEASHSALKHTSTLRTAAVLKTSKRLAIRAATNATRNVSSVFAEAILLLGTGIMLGVTAWDLYDACDTLKDINELNSVFDLQKEDQNIICGMKVPTTKQVFDETRTNTAVIYQSAKDALKKGGIEIAH